MNDFKRISIDEAHALITSDTDTVLVVDVRDANSYDSARIEGAVHLENDNVQAFLADTPRDQALIVYCFHGNSSLNAAQFLVQQGFDKVMTMDGGFEAWRQRYPHS